MTKLQPLWLFGKVPKFCRRKDVILKMNIFIHGKDARLKFCKEFLLKESKLENREANLFLLPIPTTKDGITINKTEETFEDFIKEVRSGDIVVGYEFPKSAKVKMSCAAVYFIDVARDEKYLAENAELTAIGTLGRILTESDKAPSLLNVAVIGYGRIGQRLVRDLMFFGARVSVFTSKKEVREDLCRLGIAGVDSLSLDATLGGFDFSSFDLVINTAPAKLITSASTESLRSVRVIELASGNNIPDGISYERFSAIPAVMYPKSAAKSLKDSIMRMLGG